MLRTDIPSVRLLMIIAVGLLVVRHTSYGFYILSVFLSGQEMPFLTLGGIDFYPLWANSWVGIDMIYMLAGFSAARLWLDEKPQSAFRLALQKILPLLPLYYVILLICYFFVPFFVLPKQPTPWSVFYHLAVLPDIFEPGVNVSYAVVAAKIKMILLLVGVLWLLGKVNIKIRLGVTLVSLAGMMLGGYFLRLHGFSEFTATGDIVKDSYEFFMACRFAFFYCLDPFVCGAVIAWASHRLPPDHMLRQPLFCRAILYAGSASLLLWLFSTEHLRVITSYDAGAQPLVTALIIAAILYGAVMPVKPRQPETQGVGRLFDISYAVYLIHIPLIQVSFYTAAVLIYPLLHDYPLFFHFFAFSVIYISFSYLAGAALHHWIEKPAFRIFRVERETAEKENTSS